MFSRKSNKIIEQLRAGGLVTSKEAQYLRDELWKHLQAIHKAMYVTHSREETTRRQKITGEVVDLLAEHLFAEIKGFTSKYSPEEVEGFDRIVVDHIKSLSPDYYKEMRE